MLSKDCIQEIINSTEDGYLHYRLVNKGWYYLANRRLYNSPYVVKLCDSINEDLIDIGFVIKRNKRILIVYMFESVFLLRKIILQPDNGFEGFRNAIYNKLLEFKSEYDPKSELGKKYKKYSIDIIDFIEEWNELTPDYYSLI